MYVTELLFNFISGILKKRNNKVNKAPGEYFEYNSDDDETGCEHIFLPVDSSGEILACSKCGKIVKKRDFYGKNFFTDGKA